MSIVIDFHIVQIAKALNIKPQAGIIDLKRPDTDALIETVKAKKEGDIIINKLPAYMHNKPFDFVQDWIIKQLNAYFSARSYDKPTSPRPRPTYANHRRFTR